MYTFELVLLCSLAKYPVLQFLDHRVVLFLTFTICHSGCTSLQSHQPCMSVFSTSSPTPAVSCVVDFSHSDRCEVILISLMLSDVEHRFMCLLAIWISSLEKCLFVSSAYQFFMHFGY